MTETATPSRFAPDVREAAAALNFRCPFCGTPVVVKYVIHLKRYQVSRWARDRSHWDRWFAHLSGRERRQRVEGGPRHTLLDDGYHECAPPEETP